MFSKFAVAYFAAKLLILLQSDSAISNFAAAKFSKSTGSLSQATGNREERFALGSASCSPVRLTSWL
jgi:hypothetical protein